MSYKSVVEELRKIVKHLFDAGTKLIKICENVKSDKYSEKNRFFVSCCMLTKREREEEAY